ncbi:MAG: GNAT family N-acetyltransferase [Erythrobacter sp.]
MQFGIANLDDPGVGQLLEFHHKEMLAGSPPGTAYAFDLERLRSADISLFTARGDSILLAVAALRSHKGFAEIKSMRAAPAAVGKGAGKGLLAFILNEARDAGYGMIKLETGISEVFEPANGLYRAFGFAECEPFGGYEDNGHNRFYELKLTAN